jgi:hypothetical protein
MASCIQLSSQIVLESDIFKFKNHLILILSIRAYVFVPIVKIKIIKEKRLRTIAFDCRWKQMLLFPILLSEMGQMAQLQIGLWCIKKRAKLEIWDDPRSDGPKLDPIRIWITQNHRWSEIR